VAGFSVKGSYAFYCQSCWQTWKLIASFVGLVVLSYPLSYIQTIWADHFVMSLRLPLILKTIYSCL
jgi:hypothetical protein